MKILIAYASKYGTTEECAKILAEQFKNHEVAVVKIEKVFEPNLREYDVVIFGSNIRMAKIDKTLREYLRANENTLSQMRCAYFLCCGFVDCFDEYVENNIPKLLRDSALNISCFGGSMEVSRAKGLDKFIISAVRSDILGGGQNGQERDDISLPTILSTNIVQMADYIIGKYRQ